MAVSCPQRRPGPEALNDGALACLLFAAAEAPGHSSRPLYPYLVQAASRLQKLAQGKGEFAALSGPALEARVLKDIAEAKAMLGEATAFRPPSDG